MAITYFPFDAGDGANVYESQWAEMAEHWLGTGVISGELNTFEVYADDSGMQVKVKSGKAWIKGHYMKSTAEETKTISAADGSNPRWDRVVLRLDWDNNDMAIEVLEGTPAASPTVPALTQTSSVWEIALAKVYVDTGDVSLAADTVTDERSFAGSGANSLIISVTAGENLTAGNYVFLESYFGAGSAAQAYLADADTREESIWSFLGGVATATISSGAVATIQIAGIVTGLSSLTAGKLVYLSETSGGLTHTARGTYSRIVGLALSSTTMLLLPPGVGTRFREHASKGAWLGGASTAPHGGSQYDSVDVFDTATEVCAASTALIATYATVGSCATKYGHGYIAGGYRAGYLDPVVKWSFIVECSGDTGSDLSDTREGLAGVSDRRTEAFFAGGYDGSYKTVADKLTYATEVVAATAAADLSDDRAYVAGVSEGDTKGYFLGGQDGSYKDVADKVVYATDTTAAAATANLSTARQEPTGFSDFAAAGYILGGYTGADSAVADKLTFATDTTAAAATADLAAARRGPAAFGTGGIGYTAGGVSGANAQDDIYKTVVSTDTTSALTLGLQFIDQDRCDFGSFGNIGK